MEERERERGCCAACTLMGAGSQPNQPSARARFRGAGRIEFWQLLPYHFLLQCCAWIECVQQKVLVGAIGCGAAREGEGEREAR